MLKSQLNDLVRINKRTARKLYREKYRVYIYPVKVNIFSPWFQAFEIQNNSDRAGGFDEYVDSITIYNCNYETGYYCKYYVSQSELDYRKTHEI